jgi:hypothetical protein
MDFFEVLYKITIVLAIAFRSAEDEIRLRNPFTQVTSEYI